jgi:PAS domain S-box-containing protein
MDSDRDLAADQHAGSGDDGGRDEPFGEPGGLLDILGLAAVALDSGGRVALWSPQAQELFGYTADEALGRPAADLLADGQRLDVLVGLFAHVMSSGEPWAAVFPVPGRGGDLRLAEFRTMRLEDRLGRPYALGLAANRATVRRLERDLALSLRLVEQSPVGLAIMDAALRFVLVNPALARINGLPSAAHLGRTLGEVLPFLDVQGLESALGEVLATGAPALDLVTAGCTPADPQREHVWQVSMCRLEDSAHRVIGVASSVEDVTERHRAEEQAAQARRRLAVVMHASDRIGTTLDLTRTAQELARAMVPEFADLAAVDVLDAGADAAVPPQVVAGHPAVFRALALVTGYPTPLADAADPVGQPARCDATRLVTRCVSTGWPVLVAHVTDDDLSSIARDAPAARLLREGGVHSYMAVPLRARGHVIGALDLIRSRNPASFDSDDVHLASELASRAAIAIDNAGWYECQRHTALALQRHLLPDAPATAPGLRLAHRYQPASDTSEVGGDWFDVISLTGRRTALVIGDVMGHGIQAAATMGQLRTATRTLAGLDLEPAAVLAHLDRITAEAGESIATCLYAVYDPHEQGITVAGAGHLPPVLIRGGRAAELLDLPTGAPLGVGGVRFESSWADLRPGDELLLYTDGLVEARDRDIGTGLRSLTDLLSRPRRDLDETCELLLAAMRHRDDPDDVALLIARALAAR